ncbi:MAG: PAS domain S-box protein [Desulfovibrionaceae bacterium]
MARRQWSPPGGSVPDNSVKSHAEHCKEIAALEKKLAHLECENAQLRDDIGMLRVEGSRVLWRHERLRQILESCPDSIVEYSPEGRITYVNTAFEQTFSVARRDMYAGAFTVIPADCRKEQEEIIQAMRAGGVIRGKETRRMNRYGMELHIRLTAVPARQDDGCSAGHIEFLTDITENRMIQESLEESQERFQSLLEASPDPILVYDGSGGLSYVNPAFEQVFGWRRAVVLGGTVPNVPEDARERNEKAVARALQGHKMVFETRRVTAQGNELDMLASMAPYTGVGEEIIGYIEVLKDISDRKQAERALADFNRQLERTVEERTRELAEKAAALEEAVERLKELDTLKSDFLSMISHELRTPLTSVRGFAKMVAKRLETVVFPAMPPGDARVRKAMDQAGQNLHVIVAEADRLATLVNNVLDLVHLESGRAAWRFESLAASEVFAAALAPLRPAIAQRSLRLVEEYPLGLPPLRGDAMRVVQVLGHLVSNAVKFTDRGGITCSASASNGDVLLTVADTGSGIRPEDQDDIFSRFRQLGSVDTDKPGGIGLGLAICKEIVTAHQGSITVESAPGGGTRVQVRLPAAT